MTDDHGGTPGWRERLAEFVDLANDAPGWHTVVEQGSLAYEDVSTAAPFLADLRAALAAASPDLPDDEAAATAGGIVERTADDRSARIARSAYSLGLARGLRTAAAPPQEGGGGAGESDCARCLHTLAQHPAPNEWQSSCTECRCPGWWSQRHLIHLADEDGNCTPGCPTCAGLTWRADEFGPRDADRRLLHDLIRDVADAIEDDVALDPAMDAGGAATVAAAAAKRVLLDNAEFWTGDPTYGEVEYGCLSERVSADDEPSVGWTISADSSIARQMVEQEDPETLVWRASSDWQPWPPPINPSAPVVRPAGVQVDREAAVDRLLAGGFSPSEYEGRPELQRAWASKVVAALAPLLGTPGDDEGQQR